MKFEIYKKWLVSWDVELQRKHRKMLLVIDKRAPPVP
jgi:hypothetical protein